MDGVETDHFAGQEKPEHLLVAIGVDHVGLDRAAAHRGNGVEGIAFTKEVFAGRKRTDMFDQAMQLDQRSEEHTSELQSLMRISYAVFCLKTKKCNTTHRLTIDNHTRLNHK